MKKILILTLLFAVACTTYDLPVIYKKNFQPGTNPLLHLDGFYADTLGPKQTRSLNDPYGKPMLFYANGSAYACETFVSLKGAEKMISEDKLNGSWGNYKVNGDTILFERFHLVNSAYRRIILKGIIGENSIHWISRKEHKEEYKPVDYTSLYRPCAQRPDSAKNWTRTKPKFNK